EDDQVFVNAGSNTMAGRFTMPGFTPSKDWISADIGVNWQVGSNTTAFVAYSGHFSDDQQDGNSISLVCAPRSDCLFRCVAGRPPQGGLLVFDADWRGFTRMDADRSWFAGRYLGL